MTVARPVADLLDDGTGGVALSSVCVPWLEGQVVQQRLGLVQLCVEAKKLFLEVSRIFDICGFDLGTGPVNEGWEGEPFAETK